MKISKTAAATARRLFGLCQVDGRLDEDRLRKVIKSLSSEKPRDYHAILGALQRLTRLELNSRKVVVESAVELDEIKPNTRSIKLNCDCHQAPELGASIAERPTALIEGAAAGWSGFDSGVSNSMGLRDEAFPFNSSLDITTDSLPQLWMSH